MKLTRQPETVVFDKPDKSDKTRKSNKPDQSDKSVKNRTRLKRIKNQVYLSVSEYIHDFSFAKQNRPKIMIFVVADAAA